MRIGILILVLILATGVGILLGQDPGYALFAYKGWTVEMPLWLTFAMILLSIIVILFGIYLFQAFFSLFHTLRIKWHHWHKTRARRQTAQGLLELAKGRWKNAERFLIQGATLSDTPLINYLSAAKAAEERGHLMSRDHYLKQALEHAEDSDWVVRLTKAQLQLKEGQLDDSLAILKQLYQQEPNNVQVLKYLCMVYEAQGDYPAVLILLPSLRKHAVFKAELLTQLEIKAYQRLLPKMMETDKKDGVQQILQFWKKAPSTIQSNTVLLAQYCSLLIDQGLDVEVEALLRTALKKGLDNHLIYLYGLIRHNTKKQMFFAETFLNESPNNPVLLLTLGKLCFSNQLFGKARDYLENSVSLKPSPEAYRELAHVYEKMGLTAKRDQCYKLGLSSATEGSIFLESLVS